MPNPYPLLSLGFRPFFLAAGAVGCLSLLAWLAMLHGLVPINLRFVGSAWHAHEMLYGYTLAVIAGFLLTAVRNWTGQATASGAELAGLVLLWLIARVLPWLALPVWGDALLAAAFPLALAWSMRRPLWNGPNPVNRVFLLLLGGMAVAVAWSHLSAAGAVPAGLLDADGLMLALVLITLLIVSGRVLPFFTQAAINDAEPKSCQWLETTTFVAAGAWLAADLISPWPALKAITSLALALSLIARLAGWHDRRAWRIPILAVLYAGALWLIVGLMLDAGAELGLMAPNIALHALDRRCHWRLHPRHDGARDPGPYRSGDGLTTIDDRSLRRHQPRRAGPGRVSAALAGAVQQLDAALGSAVERRLRRLPGRHRPDAAGAAC